jgi:hypothetical protein
MSVTELDSYRPHVTLRTPDGNVHVIPVATFDRIIAGEISVRDIDDCDLIVRAVFSDWLLDLRERA